jgi:hypothetical protein
MSHYADSSFLVSCYVADAHTPQARFYLSTRSVPLVFNALHALEVRNALKLGVFRGLFTAADAAAAWRNVEGDLKAGRLLKTPAKWPLVFRLAARMSEQHSLTTGTRSLDVLHVAVAKSLRAVEFLSFRQAAKGAGIGRGFERCAVERCRQQALFSRLISLRSRHEHAPTGRRTGRNPDATREGRVAARPRARAG